MTRREFEVKAIRAAERAIGAPAGWWGTWCDLRGPGGIRVRRAAKALWIVRRRGVIVSRHDSKFGAIRKAAKLPWGVRQ